MISLLLFAEVVTASPRPVAAAAPAQIAVRIERSRTVTPEGWEKAPPAERREIERTDENGRRVKLRLIEYR